MPDRPIVRRARPDDWPAVAALHALSWQSAYRGIYPDAFLDRDVVEDRRAFWRERLPAMDGESDAVFVAERDDKPIGFVCIRRESDPAGPVLDNLHVDPECKGGGIGRRLIRAAASWLTDRSPDASLQLYVWAANHAARGFYDRLGAVEVERFEEEVPGGGMASIVRMRWERARLLRD
jgi:ribosomal protein S18 acetylase RimI-like enzyme